MATDKLISQLPTSLVAAYRATQYKVDAPGGAFTLHVDEPSVALAALYETFSVDSAAYLTAYNPFSRQASLEENISAKRALAMALRSKGLHWLRGEAVDSHGVWPAEPSVLVLGIDPDTAFDLACQFDQNGFLLCGDDALPRLVLTR